MRNGGRSVLNPLAQHIFMNVDLLGRPGDGQPRSRTNLTASRLNSAVNVRLHNIACHQDHFHLYWVSMKLGSIPMSMGKTP